VTARHHTIGRFRTAIFEYRYKSLFFQLFVTLSALIFLIFPRLSTAADVQFFTVQGLRLDMTLDEVIKAFDINNVKSSRDGYGIVNGYEIVKTKGEEKIVLNFTGFKRLYRIDFSNQYPNYINNSEGIYTLLKKRYGKPDIENIEVFNGESRDIRVCWGLTCNRFSPITPALKATIEYHTGKLKLTLVDNRIFNNDWKKYKESYNEIKTGRRSTNSTVESKPGF